MGLLSLGTPLDWHDSKKYNEKVREDGTIQLINIFKQHDQRQSNPFLWGDEVEYMLVDFDDKHKTAKLSIDQDHILKDLNDPLKSFHKSTENKILFHPEYGRFMIESTPQDPYDGLSLKDYVYVEENMKRRREVSQSELPSNIRPLTITVFPRMGCSNFTSLPTKPIGPASQSLFLPDEIINRHVRFPTLTANIRKRRGCKVSINIPFYPDVNTKLMDDSIWQRDLFKSDREPYLGAAIPGHVYMDSMGFGMGSSCVQVTAQASDINEARYLYDSLAPLTPILLSLSAAAPAFKGFLVNQDVRWNVVSGSVDDRTFVEKGTCPYTGYDNYGGLNFDKKTIKSQSLSIDENGEYEESADEYGESVKLTTNDKKPIQKIPKSRYDSIDSYLGDEAYGTSYFSEDYNDIFSPINRKVYKNLIDSGHFDPTLAKHFAHLFIRDPLVLFSERVNQDNELDNDHFENIQSTNWQTLRFKPPALYEKGQDISKTPGWRVEFRPTEVQLTDFENAAYSVFIILVSRAILKFKPNFYIPISKIDENMKTAHAVDSVLDRKFWFKSFEDWNLNSHDFMGYDLSWFDRYINAGSDELDSNSVYIAGYSNGPESNSCSFSPGNESLYSVNEIVNGNDKFPGLIKLVVKFIATDLIPHDQHCRSEVLAKKLIRIQAYLCLLSRRATGKIPTTAHWVRNRVLSSPLYKQDSKISDNLNYYLMKDARAVADFSDKDLMQSLFGKDLTDFIISNK